MNRRKVIMYCIAIGALALGLVLCFLPFVAAAYPEFCSAIGVVTGAAMAGNVGEHVAAAWRHRRPDPRAVEMNGGLP